MAAIESNLAELRKKRNLPVQELAAAVGISRQTVYAMENGAYVPNTALALRLARELETTVEELFRLPECASAPAKATTAELLPGSGPLKTGQAVQLCRVDRKMVASASFPLPWNLPASDAVMVESAARADQMRFSAFDNSQERFANRILIAGCDPGISVLAKHAMTAGVNLVLAHRNSSQSLEFLKEGLVHVAGTHLRDEVSGESNLPAIKQTFPKGAVAVMSFAIWEEGIVTARGNPKKIRGVEDLARKDIALVNREIGSGSRKLLDFFVERAGIKRRQIRGYNKTAHGLLPAAWEVFSGSADCCISTRAAARVFGLEFFPLITERYDLAIRKRHLSLPSIQNLLDVMSRLNFRRELEALGGYDTKVAGKRLL